MAFYDLPKNERIILTDKIKNVILSEIENDKKENILNYSSDKDTYIRKTTYLIISRLYRDRAELKYKIIKLLKEMFESENEKIRQTATYTLGEIGKKDAENILPLLEKALFDKHHSVRNAVTGAIKQMSEMNPEPTLNFVKKFLQHQDPVIKRIIIHGIELRGRTCPEDILPLLKIAQNDKSKIVSEILVHVLGQISYKKGCLEKVTDELKTWQNKEIINRTKKEIIEVHKRYKKFSFKTPEDAEKYLNNVLK